VFTVLFIYIGPLAWVFLLIWIFDVVLNLVALRKSLGLILLWWEIKWDFINLYQLKLWNWIWAIEMHRMEKVQPLLPFLVYYYYYYYFSIFFFILSLFFIELNSFFFLIPRQRTVVEILPKRRVQREEQKLKRGKNEWDRSLRNLWYWKKKNYHMVNVRFRKIK
jgi:hypothetical protein